VCTRRSAVAAAPRRLENDNCRSNSTIVIVYETGGPQWERRRVDSFGPGHRQRRRCLIRVYFETRSALWLNNDAEHAFGFVQPSMSEHAVHQYGVGEISVARPNLCHTHIPPLSVTTKTPRPGHAAQLHFTGLATGIAGCFQHQPPVARTPGTAGTRSGISRTPDRHSTGHSPDQQHCPRRARNAGLRSRP
jgi:hypothetical protein